MNLDVNMGPKKPKVDPLRALYEQQDFWGLFTPTQQKILEAALEKDGIIVKHQRTNNHNKKTFAVTWTVSFTIERTYDDVTDA